MITKGSPTTKVIQQEVSIEISAYEIRSITLQLVSDSAVDILVAYVTKDADGNVLENLTYVISGSDLSTMMGATITSGTRLAAIRDAVYTHASVTRSIFI